MGAFLIIVAYSQDCGVVLFEFLDLIKTLTDFLLTHDLSSYCIDFGHVTFPISNVGVLIYHLTELCAWNINRVLKNQLLIYDFDDE